MIGNPINDAECLSKITDEIVNAVECEEVRNVARRFDSTKALAAWIRSLPQRNDSGDLNLTDAVQLLNFLFAAGQSPAPPFEECGEDPTEDDNVECSFAPCGG